MANNGGRWNKALVASQSCVGCGRRKKLKCLFGNRRCQGAIQAGDEQRMCCTVVCMITKQSCRCKLLNL
jgi:hypothetical protein